MTDKTKIEIYTGVHGHVIIRYNKQDTGIRLSNNGKGEWRLTVRGFTEPCDYARMIHDHDALRDLVAPHLK